MQEKELVALGVQMIKIMEKDVVMIILLTYATIRAKILIFYL